MTSFETIPLPAAKARRKEPIAIETGGLDAWPRRRFRFRFDYNTIEERWNWEVELQNFGTIVRRKPVMLMYPYTYRGYIMFMFIDDSRTETAVTASNLGDGVFLSAFPGPQSPGYDDWLAEQPDLVDGEEVFAQT